MKRLLGLGVLFVVLGLSVPSSYAAPTHYLIYNISTTVKGADRETNAKVAIPMKGYLVLFFADGCDTPADANLFLYGNDSNTPKKKVYVQLNARGSNNFLAVSAWHIGDLMFVDLQGNSPFVFKIMLQGKLALKDIGFGTADKRMVATSIKGVNIAEGSFLLGPLGGQWVSGTGSASATLNTVLTKAANAESRTRDEIVYDLIYALVDKGFIAATLPD
jgi:hypothetical protein